MTSVITNEGQSEHKRRVLANKGDVFASFDVEDFTVPRGRDEEWRFTPLRRLAGLHDGTAGDPVAASITVEGADAEGVTVETVGRDDERLGRAGTPTDRVAAQAYSSFEQATVVTFGKGAVSAGPVTVTVDGPGEGNVSYGHIVIDVREQAEAVVILDYRGTGVHADNVEFVGTGPAGRRQPRQLGRRCRAPVRPPRPLGRDSVLRHPWPPSAATWSASSRA